ncbi:MAG: hypothetical protein CMI16_11430 [Opitutaceae bacterium]|nr:hypothetical protein [Opitutaceae bacterium]|tara:strand:- start:66 stop:299 length:234 start_codon:yes stop_codon:yes gene_type:complete
MGGITGWIYHRLQTRGKRVRDEAISEIQQEEAHQARDYITKSVNTISASLHELSEDSLLRWQRRYRVDSRSPVLPLK